jgi:hypothetical protein
MKKITLLTFFLLSVALGYSQCGTNNGTELIANGGFETGDLTNWDVAGGGISVVNTNPSEGTFAANLNNTTLASSSSIKSPNRGVGVICAGEQVTISFDYRGEAVAGGVLFVELFSEFSGGGATNQLLNGGAPFIPSDLNTWISYQVTTTVGADVSGGVSLLFNAVTGGASGSVSNIFIDNVSMVIGDGVSPDADASLSDLTLDGNTISGFSPGVVTYNVELPNGTTTAPTVAGVATQAGNGSSNVSVTQASGVPGTATLEVTAPNGTDTRTYTVNFSELPALPPAAPTPPSINTISVLSDVYTNIAVPQVDVFGGTLTNFDLNFNGNQEARLITGGSGFQFNFFPGAAFVDITPAQFLHVDIYCENLADNDILRIRLLDPDPGANGSNIARVQLSAAQSGTWVSVDLELPSGSNLNDFGDIDSAASPVDLSQLSLIQFNTLDLGSSLASKEVYLSNIYFYGGALSTADETLSQVKIFPNPTNDVWTLSSPNTIVDIQVFDILGKQVVSINPNTNEATINATNLKDGLYLAKISTINGSQTVKLIKN